MRDAFARAERRPRRKLTYVHKHNVLVHAGHLWRRTVERVGASYPDVAVDYLHVDAATIFLVTDPGRFDVLVTDNLFGDILTDLAAAVTGGIGLAASGNVNPDRTTPSMFEPCTGRRRTSPDAESPTPPRPSCPWRCCWIISATPTRRAGSRTPWLPTSGRVVGQRGRQSRPATLSPRC